MQILKISVLRRKITRPKWKIDVNDEFSHRETKETPDVTARNNSPKLRKRSWKIKRRDANSGYDRLIAYRPNKVQDGK